MPKRPPRSRRRSISRTGADVSGYGLAGLLVAVVRAYRVAVSPVLAPSCRFAPSCSAYAEEALERHGARGGLVLAVRRLARCHPWNDGGYDPVPTGEGQP